MSNIKALEKLRELCADVKSMDFASVGCDAVLEIADEIEQEIAERFIELPVDAEGVPIKPNDIVYDGESDEIKPQTVLYVAFSLYGDVAVQTDDMGWKEIPRFFETRDYKDYTHVNPRTIEDAISDAIRDYATTDMSREEIAAKYAEEIRGMMA